MVFAQEENTVSNKTHVDVYYFHHTDRCATCLSIEENTKSALDLYFADEMKDGTISFYSVCYEDDSDKKAVEKYEVDGPALYLTKVKKGKETNKNLTDFAFDNSLHNADKFKNGLRDKMNELLR
jgi:hypothetical protein